MDEGDQAFTIELFDPVNADFSGGATVLRKAAWVLDGDGSTFDRNIFVSSPIILENDDGSRDVEFEVSLSEASASPLSFDYTTKSDSATAGEDFTATSGTLTFGSGQTSKIVRVPIIGDKEVEVSEIFHLVVTPTLAISDGGRGATGTAKILDDDAVGGVPIVSLEFHEGAQEGEESYFVIRLDRPSLGDITLNAILFNQTANVEDDLFDDTFFPITILAGQTSYTLPIDTRADALDEGDESYIAVLSNVEGAVFEGNVPVLRATGFVYDNDGSTQDLTFGVEDVSIVEGDTGRKQAVFEVHLSERRAEEIRLDYRTDDFTATAGQDYVGQTGTLVFAPGQLVATVTVDILGDRIYDGTESFDLLIDGPYPAQFASAFQGATGRAYIEENEIGGDEGDNELTGDAFSNAMFGFGGDDDVSGKAGDDSLYGGSGRDNLSGGSGRDFFSGGDGIDTADFSGKTSVNISLAKSDFQKTGHGIDKFDSIENVKGSSSADRITGDSSANTFNASGGADKMVGGGGSDTGYGGGGSDNFSGGKGADKGYGGIGDDTFKGGKGSDKGYGGDGADTFNGGAGNDLGYGGSSGSSNVQAGKGPAAADPTDILFGGAGDDRLYGGGGTDLIGGGADDDRLFGESGTDTISGGAGADLLKGGQDKDKLYGGTGADTLEGGAGTDQLWGGAGPDAFVFGRGDGKDRIRDFEAGIDTIEIAKGASKFSDLSIELQGADTVVSFANVEITISNLRPNDLDADDFSF